MKTIAYILYFVVTAFLLGCGSGGGSSSNGTVDVTSKVTTNMCQNRAGTYLYVNCRAVDTCGNYQQTPLASYTNTSSCNGDLETVVNTYSNTGNIAPGPNAYGGNGGGSGGQGYACLTTDDYSGGANFECAKVTTKPFTSSTCPTGGGFTAHITSSCPPGVIGSEVIGTCSTANGQSLDTYYKAALQNGPVSSYQSACKSIGGTWQ